MQNSSTVTTRRAVPLLAAICLVLLTGSPSAAPGTRTDLTMEERVRAQRAIEEVHWRHRIWPGENGGAKPPLDAVLSEAKLRAKVEDYLKESNAAEVVWRRPITASQLQDEMERMAKQTRAPEVLREIFAALGDDPRLIAETLARQTLADRLVRGWYARDERFHGGVRRRAEAALAGASDAKQLRTLGAEYAETTWRLARPDGAKDEPPSATKPGAIVLEAAEWREQVTRLAEMLDAGHGRSPAEQTLEGLPLMTVSRLREEDGAFVVTGLLRRGQGTFTTATAWWPKTTFDRWWSGGSAFTGALTAPTRGNFERVTVAAVTACVPDSWTPDGRSDATAVWTGSEMIVWGGHNARTGIIFNDGARYNPSTDSWVPTTTDGAPAARYGHTAVWMGTLMIVWGGVGAGYFNELWAYDPSADYWLNGTTNGAPAERAFHSAVWTGRELIVWGGGNDGGELSDGGRYDPFTDRWVVTTTSGAPAGRSFHTAVWTGSEMIVWGGRDGASYVNDGGRYNPATDTWLPTTITGAPTARYSHTAVWTGTEMIIWGGSAGYPYDNDGGRYDPSTDSWAPTAASGAPGGRYLHTAVWTGSEMIVWGGIWSGHGGSPSIVNDGGRYNASTDSWLPIATSGAPGGRYSHTAVWTGTEMIVWGGSITALNAYDNDGGRYIPSTNSWVPLTHTWVPTTTSGAPAARSSYTAVWTGTEMIIWGGHTSNGLVNDGGRYTPSTDSWTPTTTSGAPVARAGHMAVWTGSEMIVWGGSSAAGYSNDGGRYSPFTDAWAPTTITGAPDGRLGRAVWTGSEMIVWGGYGGSYLNDGGRYDPSTDRWTPTTTNGAPVARAGHTTVWTGTEMIVWGGGNGSSPQDPPLNSGGRYRPSTNSWLPTSLSFPSPSRRFGHTAVWTGSEMIIWGGRQEFIPADLSPDLGDGWRYNPSTDSWVLIMGDFHGAPAPRSYHSAVWTGSEMIVWGGYEDGGFSEFSGPVNDGWRYSPSSDSWVQTATSGAPSARWGHTAVWTSNEMIVWGGAIATNSGTGMTYYINSGGRYCVGVVNCPTWYQDGDGDGYGSSSVPQVACVQPSGFVPMPGDCNDSNPAVYPGAAETCDGVDDNCNGLIDEDATGIDSDGDGIHNVCDNCPNVSNPDQDPCACGPSCGASDLTISFDSPEGHGSGVVRWLVARESDVVGFNVVEIDSKGNRTQINPVIIPCAECSSGLGHAYMAIVPRHQSGRGFFVEVVRLHGPVSVYGPAQRI